MTDMAELVEITALEAWERLRKNGRAVLLDVRSEPEWDFVGVPLVDGYLQISWRHWPDMRINPDFLVELDAAGVDRDTPLLLMCKAGVRSREAGEFLLRRGFLHCFNISDGFEGERDEKGRRRRMSGWVAAGLPWMQC